MTKSWGRITREQTRKRKTIQNKKHLNLLRIFPFYLPLFWNISVIMKYAKPNSNSPHTLLVGYSTERSDRLQVNNLENNLHKPWTSWLTANRMTQATVLYWVCEQLTWIPSLPITRCAKLLAFFEWITEFAPQSTHSVFSGQPFVLAIVVDWIISLWNLEKKA